MLNLAALRLRTVARRAARDRDWNAAIAAYRKYLGRSPRDARAWVQYGHAAKENGDFVVAADAYGHAVALAADVADNWLHLSHVRKRLGDRRGAIDACVHALTLDPGFANAADELVALGARDSIPVTDAADGPHGGAPAFADHGGGAVYPLSRYDRFRHGLAIAAPPRDDAVMPALAIVIDARAAMPAAVRATLSALLDQTDERWRAVVLASPALRAHSVASLAALDDRVRFVDMDPGSDDIGDGDHAVLIAAGTVLDRQAIAWFVYVAYRTACVAAYCDHDRSVDDWRTGRTFLHPVFQPMFDPDWFGQPSNAPLAIMVDRRRVNTGGWIAGDAGRIACAAALAGPVVHLPLMLASDLMPAPQAEQAPPDPRGSAFAAAPAVPRVEPERPVTAGEDRIQVVIQTRDEADMLRIAIDSIRTQASRPDLLDIVVVDNRSREAATERLLRDLQRGRIATTLTLDEPFNWSRANNLAVAGGVAPVLLFLNNDTQMLTSGWDAMLRDLLGADDVGAVGATLLYPDHTIQHAGIVMGMGSGGPIHEGVGRDVASGPNDRWRRRRSVSAVTGAFLAMRRDVFDAVEGFDALRFSIAFNDIDLCLRVRATGRRVVMASDIQAIHHESKTRGINVTRSQVAWDLGELGRLHDRWGAALFEDPAYNPHWTRIGQPFDGCRYPSRREIMRHIDHSARVALWAPGEAQQASEWW